MARKLTIIAALAAVLSGCMGCGKLVPKTNTIAPMALTQEQQEIVDLLTVGSGHEILLFSYEADAEYTSIEVWVEVYQDGVLTEPFAGGLSMISDNDGQIQGELAVLITQNPDFQYTFIRQEGGAKYSHTSDPIPGHGKMGRAFGPIADPVGIEDGIERILYTSVFTDGTTLRAYDARTLEEEPERLEEYDYAHIIKCKFSK